MSSNFSGEGEIRKNIIEATIVDCMIALPSQLFYTAPIARANVRLVNRLTTIFHTKKSYVKQIMLREDFSVIEVIF
jgi:type I restriction-modification system DNA methylase subunit